MAPTETSRMRQMVLAYFRLWSRVYDSPLFQTLFFHRVHRRVLDATRAFDPQDVLDVGCGTGELLLELVRRWPGARFSGLDVSADMLAKARAKDYGAAPVDFREGEVESLPFPGGSFDLVTNTISSHYYPDLALAAGEIARVLRPGGRLVMASLTNGPLGWFPGSRGEAFVVLEATYRSPRHQRGLLEEAGFEIESARRAVGGAWLYVARRPEA